MPSSKAPQLPYISFRHLEDAFARMALEGLPRTLGEWKYPGTRTVRSQLHSAFRFLCLVDSEEKPTPHLFALVSSIGTGGYAGELSAMLHRSYPDLAGLDLATATPSMAADMISRHCKSADGARKALRFYLQAAKKAGLPIGPRLSYGRRSPAPVPRAKGTPRAHKPESLFVLREFIQKVPEFDETWPEKVQVSWLQAMGKLAERL
jgi:hypothetical protein